LTVVRKFKNILHFGTQSYEKSLHYKEKKTRRAQEQYTTQYCSIKPNNKATLIFGQFTQEWSRKNGGKNRNNSTV